MEGKMVFGTTTDCFWVNENKTLSLVTWFGFLILPLENDIPSTHWNSKLLNVIWTGFNNLLSSPFNFDYLLILKYTLSQIKEFLLQYC